MVNRSLFLSVCVYALFAVCPLLFFTDLTRNPYFTQIALLNVLVCLCWLAWIWDAWKQKEWVWVHSPLDRVLWALMGVCTLSWLSAFIQHPNFRIPIYSEGSRSMIFLIVNTLLIYAAAIRYQDRTAFQRLLWVSYAVAVAASVYGIAQYYGTEWIWPHNLNPYGSRPVSTFGNPNFMSSYLVVILPVAIADYVFQVTGLSRVPLFIVIISSLGALIATLTRSSWGGLLVGLVFVAAGTALSREIWPKARTAVYILAVAMGLSIFAWPKSSTAAYSATVLGRLTEVKQVATGTYGAVTQRLLIWSSAWSMVKDHPILGQGWGCFELFFPYYQSSHLENPKFMSYRTHANNAHNEILEYWTQVGTVGLGIILLVWLVFFRTGFSIIERLPLPWKGLEWGLLGGVAGMLADNLLNVSVHFAVPAFIFWWWVGSAFVLDPTSLRPEKYSLESPGRRAALALAAVVLMCFIGRSAMLWAEEVNFFKGFKVSKGAQDLNLARTYLEKAYRYHALDVNNAYELANVYARMGMKEKALEMYDSALAANSGYDEIYFNRATMYMQSGREEEAIQGYRRVLDINPLSREAYNALAGLYLKDIQKYGDATEALYKKAVTLFPDEKDFWNNLGYLQVQRQRWEEAYQAYRKAVEADPDFELARSNLAIAARNAGHTQDPYVALNQRFGEIEGLMKEKKWTEALAKANAVVDQLPRSARGHFYVGGILFAMNQLPEAAGQFEAAVRLHPELTSAWVNLAVTYDQLHRTPEAEAAWRQVLAQDKNNPQAKARLHL